jgi:tetratricopeptide (TPR) repeat protein
VEEYRKVIGIKPGYVSAYNNLGNIYKQRGDYAEALPLLLKAVELNPRHVNAHFNLGEVYEKTGELEKAFDHYQTALKIAPSLETAHKVGKLSQELKIVPDEEVIPYLQRIQRKMSRPIPGTPPPFRR